MFCRWLPHHHLAASGAVGEPGDVLRLRSGLARRLRVVFLQHIPDALEVSNDESRVASATDMRPNSVYHGQAR